MKLERTIPLLLLATGIAGCGASEPVDASKLVIPTAEQNAAIASYDNSVNEEEFRKPEPGSKIARPAAGKRSTGTR